MWRAVENCRLGCLERNRVRGRVEYCRGAIGGPPSAENGADNEIRLTQEPETPVRDISVHPEVSNFNVRLCQTMSDHARLTVMTVDIKVLNFYVHTYGALKTPQSYHNRNRLLSLRKV